jgi:prolipoprotein diacylglyceryltransferase
VILRLVLDAEHSRLQIQIRGSLPENVADLSGGLTQIISRTGAKLQDGSEVITQGVGVHQTALYDMLLAWVLFGVLWWFSAKDRRQGVTALLFAAAYGSFRLLEDSLRIDKRFGPLTGSQWTALTVVLVSLGILVWFAVKEPPGPTTPSRKRTVVPDAAEPQEPEPEQEPATP